jgi:succinate dehydrogenase / fumarate reductase cytochrome b subunit
VWTVSHLWNNLSAFQSADAWENAVTMYPHPFAQVFTGIVVLVPLVLHTVWGIGRLFTSRANVRRYPMWENVKYLVQRLSAIGVFFFLGAHIFKAMIEPRLKTGHGERFVDIAWHMRHHTPTLVVYVLGTLAVAYHLANGIATFAMGWGLVSTKAALRKAEWLNWTVFAILLAMSWGSIYAMWVAGS